jgi:hypothetical protein
MSQRRARQRGIFLGTFIQSITDVLSFARIDQGSYPTAGTEGGVNAAEPLQRRCPGRHGVCAIVRTMEVGDHRGERLCAL